jgi:hypothetical protein
MKATDTINHAILLMILITSTPLDFWLTLRSEEKSQKRICLNGNSTQLLESDTVGPSGTSIRRLLINRDLQKAALHIQLYLPNKVTKAMKELGTWPDKYIQTQQQLYLPLPY